MRRLSLLTALLGCGPGATPLPSDGSTGSAAPASTSGAMAPTTSSAATSVATSASDTTGTTSTDDSTSESVSGYEDDGMGTGCAFTCPTPPGPGGFFACDPRDSAAACAADSKCMPWANDGGDQWNVTRCSPVANDPDQTGEPCEAEGSPYSGVDSCDVGRMCWRVGDDNAGVCNQFCSAVAGQPICPDGFVCAEPYEFVLPICVESCDPLSPACAEFEGCYPAGFAFGCLPALPPTVADGDPCEFRTECEPGSTCVPIDDLLTPCAGEACCASLCDPDAPDCSNCRRWFDNEALPDIGYCA